MNKILAFVLLVLTFIGVVGGIGYTAYYGAWPVAIVITQYIMDAGFHGLRPFVLC